MDRKSGVSRTKLCFPESSSSSRMLRSTLLARPTNDTIAYDDYLKGRFFLNKRTTAGVQQALYYFNKAVARDPKFARAYAGLAEVYVVLPTYTDATVDSSWAGIRKNAA